MLSHSLHAAILKSWPFLRFLLIYFLASLAAYFLLSLFGRVWGLRHARERYPINQRRERENLVRLLLSYMTGGVIAILFTFPDYSTVVGTITGVAPEGNEFQVTAGRRQVFTFRIDAQTIVRRGPVLVEPLDIRPMDIANVTFTTGPSPVARDVELGARQAPVVAAPPDPDRNNHVTVKVFYGTDRKATGWFKTLWPFKVRAYKAALGMAVLLCLAALLAWRSLRFLRLVGILVCTVLLLVAFSLSIYGHFTETCVLILLAGLSLFLLRPRVPQSLLHSARVKRRLWRARLLRTYLLRKPLRRLRQLRMRLAHSPRCKSWIRFAGSIGLLCLAVWLLLSGIEILYAEHRPGAIYGNERAKQLFLGTCEVTIPPGHGTGKIESPSIVRLELKVDTRKHVVLERVDQSSSKEEFIAELRQATSGPKSAFIFVHGYNNTFEDAARRTAQIWYDLDFKGAPIFYSWPSQGGSDNYTVDEANEESARTYLEQFLSLIAAESGAETIHLIAHSMGARCMTSVVRNFAGRATKPSFDQLVLAAPDIDADVFINQIAPAIRGYPQGITLYTSTSDLALNASKGVYGSPRLGDARDIVVVPGVDTIDASATDTSFMGHSYFADRVSCLADIFYLLKEKKRPWDRFGLEEKVLQDRRYWVFRP
jgi:esterase/lipase superfamily enzyme